MPAADDAVWIDVLPSMKKFGPSLSQGVGGMKGHLGKIGLAAGAALTAGLAAATVKFTKDGAILDTKMREVVTLFGETGKAADKSLEQIRGDVRKLSDEFGIAQETLTSGLYQAISAGVPRENAFSFMQVASKAAIGGVTDVETAVDGLSSIINAFGLEASDAEAVADSMFTAVKGGKTNFEELSSSIFNVAPAAAAAKVSMQEVNAAIATLTAGGTPTAVATTQIRAALTGLQAPSEKLDKIFKALGFDNAQLAIESKGLGFALDAVKDASKGNNGTLQQLLGSTEAVAAANVIAGTGAKKFATEMKNQKSAAGATSDAFEVVNGGLERQAEIFKTQLRNVGLSVGQEVLPHVNRFMTFVNKTGIPAIKDFADVFGSLRDQVSKLGGAGGLATLKSLGDAVVRFVEPLLPILRRVGDDIMAVLIPAFKDIAAIVQRDLIPAFIAVLPIVRPIAAFLIKVIGGAVVGALKGAVQFIKGMLNIITGVFRLIKAVVTGNWSEAWDAIKQILSGAVHAITGAIKVWFNLGILAIFRQGIKFLLKSWSGLWGGIKRLGTKALGGLRTLIGNAMKAILRLFVAGVRGYLNLWRSLFRGLRDLAVTGWKVLRSAFGGAVAAIRTVFIEGMKKIKNAFVGVWTSLRNTGGKIASLVKDAIPKAFRAGRDAIGKAWGGIRELARKPVNFVIDTVYNNGLRKAFNGVMDFLGMKTRLPSMGTVGAGSGGFSGGGLSSNGNGMKAFGGAGRRSRRHEHNHLDATGGPLDWVKKIGGKGFGWVRNKVMGVVGGLADKVPGGTFGKMAGGAAMKMAQQAVDWIKGKFESSPVVAAGKMGKKGRVLPAGRYSIGMPYLGYPGHYGADYPAATGTPVYAMANGVVSRAASLTDSYGRHVYVEHPGGIQTRYAHLNSYGVRAGQQVRAGQPIGTVGSTGNSTGPHLHFEYRRNGSAVNPAGLGIFDNGGLLKQGMLAYHAARKPDRVLTDAQWRDMHAIATRAAGAAGVTIQQNFPTTATPAATAAASGGRISDALAKIGVS